jgi:hypothetical protein
MQACHALFLSALSVPATKNFARADMEAHPVFLYARNLENSR